MLFSTTVQQYSQTRTTDRQIQLRALHRSKNARGALHNFKARKQAHSGAQKGLRLERQSQLRALRNWSRLLHSR